MCDSALLYILLIKWAGFSLDHFVTMMVLELSIDFHVGYYSIIIGLFIVELFCDVKVNKYKKPCVY